jgi:hypothetical protein
LPHIYFQITAKADNICSYLLIIKQKSSSVNTYWILAQVYNNFGSAYYRSPDYLIDNRPKL